MKKNLFLLLFIFLFFYSLNNYLSSWSIFLSLFITNYIITAFLFCCCCWFMPIIEIEIDKNRYIYILITDVKAKMRRRWRWNRWLIKSTTFYSMTNVFSIFKIHFLSSQINYIFYIWAQKKFEIIPMFKKWITWERECR
jgi:hypothetical protein